MPFRLSPGLRTRKAVGPLLVAASAWCAAGTLTVGSADSASLRLADPASWWWIPIAFAAASLVKGWRDRPLSATPALFATLPWWPIALPAIALIWTGPLAWLPVLLALVAAMPSRQADKSVFGLTVPSRAMVLAGALTALFAVLTAWSARPRLPAGDEPHYLVITQSILRDGDLRIENNHENRDYAPYFRGTMRPDYLRRGADGAIYSIHAPGTAVLVLPGFLIAGYRGAQATIVLLAVLTSVLIWYAGWLATGNAVAAWFAWAAVATTVTFLMQAVTIYPDGPGALVVAVAIVLLLRLDTPHRPVKASWLAACGALLALLPWLHSRFAVLSAGCGALVAWRLVTSGDFSTSVRTRRLGTFLLIPAISAIAWFGFFWAIYGTPSPTAPYGENPETRLAYAAGGMAGILFDQQFGLLAYSPVLVAVAAGLVLRHRGSGATTRLLASLFALVVIYLATVGTYWMWWAGVPATPARFATAILPALAPIVAVAWQRSSVTLRAAWTVLLATSVAATALVLSVSRASLAWNVRGATAAWLAWLGPVVALDRAVPSFFWRLVPPDVRSELPFAIHILVWWTVVAGSLWVFVRIARGIAPADRSARVYATWWFPIATMLAVQAGWTLNRVSGIEPVISQVRWVERHAAGKPGVLIGPLHVERGYATDARIRLARLHSLPDEPSPFVWHPVAGLPAGPYEVKLMSTRVVPGTVAFRFGRAPEPFLDVALPAKAEHRLVIHVPPAAAALVVEPSAELRRAIRDVEIRRLLPGER